jgi:hypothetical protein
LIWRKPQKKTLVYTPKYNWKQNGYFPDGSVISDEDCHLVGAAVYNAHEERAYLIQPNGQGPTNTINRAEWSAIFHVLNDIWPPDEDGLIFIDSQWTWCGPARCAWSSSNAQPCVATFMRSRQQRGGKAPPSLHTT